MVTLEESIPQNSDGYRYAQSAFYSQFNDVDFYVEDAWQENLYLCILGRLFPRLKIENIHPLGGKENAIQHARVNTSRRKSIYLLDKDFDDLLGKLQKQDNVFYLEKYCIENFFIEEQAILKFIIAEKPRLKPANVQRQIEFQTRWDDIVRQLANLFALFFIVQKHNIALKSTSQKPDSFCSAADSCSIDQRRVSQYASSVRKMAAKQNMNLNLDYELQACSEQFELNKRTGFYGVNVSGEFMLHLFVNRIAKLFGLDRVPDLQSFAYRLAEKCDFHSLRALRRRMNTYLNAN
jgi:hypothetical protein